MARVTVEDCITKVPNRFDLVIMAAQRARAIAAGSTLTLERDDDRDPVVALREIAEETVDPDELEQTVVKSLQKHIEIDEPEEEEMDLLAIQQEITGAMEELGVPADLAKVLPKGEGEGEAATDDAEAAPAATDDAEAAPAADETPADADTDNIADGKS